MSGDYKASDKPATSKQKKFIAHLKSEFESEERLKECDEWMVKKYHLSDVNNPTIREASKMITHLLVANKAKES